MNHLEFAELESQGIAETDWERWATSVEVELGHSLDGDQDEDGYCMDLAYDAFTAGTTVAQHADAVRSAKDALADADSQAYQDAGEAAAHLHGAWA